METRRNEPCPCGSGKKFKQCCISKERDTPLASKLLMIVVTLVLLGGLITLVVAFRSIEPGAGAGAGKVWSEEHQHYH